MDNERWISKEREEVSDVSAEQDNSTPHGIEIIPCSFTNIIRQIKTINKLSFDDFRQMTKRYIITNLSFFLKIMFV